MLPTKDIRHIHQALFLERHAEGQQRAVRLPMVAIKSRRNSPGRAKQLCSLPFGDIIHADPPGLTSRMTVRQRAE